MPSSASSDPYRQAGVDLGRASAVVDIAGRAAAQTNTAEIRADIGGFSGAFQIPSHYQNPVLLAACDGVGTKLLLAKTNPQHHGVGIDLVAMSVNDILAQGGQPLVFLDYIATERIQPEVVEALLMGITEACKQSGCTLIGGETAEMPGFYPQGSYDVAGFCVGVAEKDALYPRKAQLKAGDVLVGLTSSGLHSNGYSLVRKILFQDHPYELNDTLPGLPGTLAEALLAPTTLYVKPVQQALTQFPTAVRAMAHITGGGFFDNIPRVLVDGLSATVDMSRWTPPPIFPVLKELGNLSTEAMAHTFNCGIGYVLVVEAAQADAVLDFFNTLPDVPFQAVAIGKLIETPGLHEVRLQ